MRILFASDVGFVIGPGFALPSPVELVIRFVSGNIPARSHCGSGCAPGSGRHRPAAHGWEQFADAQTAARRTKWWPAYFGSSTGYSSLESIQWQWDHVYSFDPLPALRSVACPVLGVFGGLDTSTPGRAAAANMRRVLAEAGNRNITIRLFERANHPLMDATTGGNAEMPSLKGTVPGLFDTLGAWVTTQRKTRR